MNHPRLAIITGFDGSGKTTMARLLVKHFRSKGYRTRYVHIKSLHTLAYLISRVLMRSGRRQLENPNKMIIYRFELPDSKFRKIWPLIEFVSVVPWVILKINLAHLLGFSIIADRYLIDTIVSISMRARNLLFANSFLGKLLLRMIPKEAVIIHLEIDFFTVLSRKPDIEYTRQEIMQQIVLYRVLTKRTSAYSIDTTMLNIKKTEARIINILSPEPNLPITPQL